MGKREERGEEVFNEGVKIREKSDEGERGRRRGGGEGGGGQTLWEPKPSEFHPSKLHSTLR